MIKFGTHTRAFCTGIDFCVDVVYDIGPIKHSSQRVLDQVLAQMAGERKVAYEVAYRCASCCQYHVSDYATDWWYLHQYSAREICESGVVKSIYWRACLQEVSVRCASMNPVTIVGRFRRLRLPRHESCQLHKRLENSKPAFLIKKGLWQICHNQP